MCVQRRNLLLIYQELGKAEVSWKEKSSGQVSPTRLSLCSIWLSISNRNHVQKLSLTPAFADPLCRYVDLINVLIAMNILSIICTAQCT
jgi:hypothetical protein